MKMFRHLALLLVLFCTIHCHVIIEKNNKENDENDVETVLEETEANDVEEGKTSSDQDQDDEASDVRKGYKLVAGATCVTSYKPLTSSWQDCRDAAVSLGYSGDSVKFVDYRYPWGSKRPQGCFRSHGNGRFHFNTGSGGNFFGDDSILCMTAVSTSGGNAGGAACIFPFVYKHKTYNSCTKVAHTKLWCATTANYDVNKKWGNCQTVGTSGGNAGGAACIFPFVYKQKTYTSCTKVAHTKLWCATTANYDVDKKWGNCQNNWKLQKSAVCFEARGNHPGSFKMQQSGTLEGIKLVHKSGYVSCGNGARRSNWGCGTNSLSTVITDSNDKMIFPKSTTSGGWFADGKYTSTSEVLVLDHPSQAIQVTKGTEMKVWYGEDLKGYTESDNSGKSCADVYALVNPNAWKIQQSNVCFGARGNHFGEFTMKQSGKLTSIKLVHKSGYVLCGGASKSNWGCGGAGLSTAITNSKNELIFPRSLGSRPWYNLAGFTSTSGELVLDEAAKAIQVKSGEKMRLWYGEDLKDYTESDNSGTSCADVYAAVEEVEEEKEKGCKKDYHKVGCFKRDLKLLTDLLITDLDATHDNYTTDVDWSDLTASLESLACRCREKVIGHYKYFAIGFFGECIAGKDYLKLEKMFESETKVQRESCIDGMWKSCDKGSEGLCVGSDDYDYFYRLNEA